MHLNLRNESDGAIYFDYFKISHNRSRIIEENHYYSFGLKIAALSSRKLGDIAEGSLKNNHQYQGEFNEFDDDLGWNDFALRNYDAQTGRFIQQDPYYQFASPYTGMGNDPINLIDPSGGFSIPLCPGASSLGVFLQKAGMAIGNVSSALGMATAITNAAANTIRVGANIYNRSVDFGIVNNQLRGNTTRQVGDGHGDGFSSSDYNETNTELDLDPKQGSGSTKKPFPSPSEILNKYPDPDKEYCSSSPDECAIRMGIALQDNDVDISSSKKFRDTHKEGKVIHQPSAAALADWISLTAQLGPPKIYVHPKGEWKESDFIGKEGIMYFVHPKRGGTGPGHIDVVSGGEIGSGFYDNKIIWFWEYKNGSYIKN